MANKLIKKPGILSDKEIARVKRESYHHESRLSPAAFDMFGRDQCIARAQNDYCYKEMLGQFRELVKQGYPEHYYPAHPKVWAEALYKKDGYESGLSAFLRELGERWQALQSQLEEG